MIYATVADGYMAQQIPAKFTWMTMLKYIPFFLILWKATTCTGQKNSWYRCPSPDPILGGRSYVSGWSVSSLLIIACNGNFTYTGNNPRHCQPNGTWSGKSGECKEIQCTHPPSLDVGQYVAVHRYKTRIQALCPLGTLYTGDYELDCIGKEEWRGKQGECEAVDMIHCDPYTPDSLAIVNPSFKKHQYNWRIDITCPEGYEYDGDTPRTCQANSTWSGKDGTCKKKECQSYRHEGHGRVLESCSPCVFGDEKKVECGEGYFYTGSVISCDKNGQWQQEKGECKRKGCSWVPAINYGKYDPRGPYQMGDVVIPLCERDYTYTGPKKFVCEGQEKWKPEFEQWDCKDKTKITCKPFDNSGMATASPELKEPRYNARITITCPEGYRYSGTRERECQANGEWSGHDGRCKAEVAQSSGEEPRHAPSLSLLPSLLIGGVILFLYLLYCQRHN